MKAKIDIAEKTARKLEKTLNKSMGKGIKIETKISKEK
jgi:F0F1-type ATP synthase delta subunit